MNTTPFFFPCLSRLACALSLFFILALLGACGSRSPESRYYILVPTMQAPSYNASAQGPRLAIGPVTLPAYLDKSAIVRRTPGSTQLAVAAFDLWAEPLEDGVARVLAGQMAAQLESTGAMVFVQRSLLEHTWRAAVNINRMDGDLNGELVLEANWNLSEQERLVREERTVLRVPTGDGIDSLVSAHAEALSQLAGQISTAFQQALAEQQLERPAGRARR